MVRRRFSSLPATSATGVENLAQRQFNVGGATYQQTYQEDGVYLGLYRGWSVYQAHTLSVMVAYAVLDGEYFDNYALQPFRFVGDATGINAALTWSGPLMPGVSYSLSLSGQRYEMDGVDTTGDFTGQTVVTTEKMTSLLGSLAWSF